MTESTCMAQMAMHRIARKPEGVNVPFSSLVILTLSHSLAQKDTFWVTLDEWVPQLYWEGTSKQVTRWTWEEHVEIPMEYFPCQGQTDPVIKIQICGGSNCLNSKGMTKWWVPPAVSQQLSQMTQQTFRTATHTVQSRSSALDPSNLAIACCYATASLAHVLLPLHPSLAPNHPNRRDKIISRDCLKGPQAGELCTRLLQCMEAWLASCREELKALVNPNHTRTRYCVI